MNSILTEFLPTCQKKITDNFFTKWLQKGFLCDIGYKVKVLAGYYMPDVDFEIFMDKLREKVAGETPSHNSVGIVATKHNDGLRVRNAQRAGWSALHTSRQRLVHRLVELEKMEPESEEAKSIRRFLSYGI
jgi:hypothetical protein